MYIDDYRFNITTKYQYKEKVKKGAKLLFE